MPKSYVKRLTELASTGASGPQIEAKLRAEGFKRSRASVGRDLRKIRGTQRVGRKSAPALMNDAPGLPSEEQIAGTDDLTTLDEWLGVAGRMARAAESRGDLAAVARF